MGSDYSHWETEIIQGKFRETETETNGSNLKRIFSRGSPGTTRASWM